YQDWLLEREWLDRLSSKAEFSTDILAAPHSSDLHEAGLRIAASQMFDQLMRFNVASETGASDQPEKFARLVNALSRLTRQALAPPPPPQPPKTRPPHPLSQDFRTPHAFYPPSKTRRPRPPKKFPPPRKPPLPPHPRGPRLPEIPRRTRQSPRRTPKTRPRPRP